MADPAAREAAVESMMCGEQIDVSITGDGAFNIPAFLAHVRQLHPHLVSLEDDSHRHVIFEDDSQKQAFLAELQAQDPSQGLRVGYGSLVFTTVPSEISFPGGTYLDEADLTIVKGLLKWLHHTYPNQLAVSNEFGTDLTEALAFL
jgi:hypothetical protein